jgi:hypothetical protein
VGLLLHHFKNSRFSNLPFVLIFYCSREVRGVCVTSRGRVRDVT